MVAIERQIYPLPIQPVQSGGKAKEQTRIDRPTGPANPGTSAFDRHYFAAGRPEGPGFDRRRRRRYLQARYPDGCPRELIVQQQESLTTEKGRLYFSIREENDPNKVRNLVDRADGLTRQIDALERSKDQYPPCRVCLYQ